MPDFIVLPHWDSMSNPPSHIILTPGRPVLFLGPYFIVSTMQAGTTPIFNVFGMTGPSSNRESNPSIVAFYDQQGLLFVTWGLHQEPNTPDHHRVNPQEAKGGDDLIHLAGWPSCLPRFG